MTQTSPLHAVCRDLGARFVDFGGWEMPVQFAGVIAEHEAVRRSVGVFDVSHLGRLEVVGPEGVEMIEAVFTNDVGGLEPGRTVYGMSLNEGGGIIDDLIVWRWDRDRLWVLPNAANSDRILERVRSGGGATVTDLRPDTAMLAVQGPDAPALIESVIGSAPKRFRLATGELGGRPVHAAGTGYTGERGGELVVASSDAGVLFRALVDGGATPCGLGARDTLRLEAGLPLWGQDLDEDVTPLEADLGFAIDWDHGFVGRNALERQRADGVTRRRVAFRTEGRLIPRPGHRLRSEAGTGTVTSGNFSPTLGHGIGLGLISDDDGSPLEVEIRGKWQTVDRVDLPFLRR